MEGKCNCEAITVRVDDPELFSRPRGHLCHCYNCRKTSGSCVAANLKIEADKVTVTGEDNLSVYHDPRSLSGNVVRRSFCKTCGTPIRSATDATDKNGITILKLGIFPQIPQPEIEGFAKDRQKWLKGHAAPEKTFKAVVGGERLEE